MARDLLLVGPEPPPTGGIASHVRALRRALAVAGVAAEVVDPRGRLRLVTELGRAALAGTQVHLHVCGHNRSSYGLLAACLAPTRARPAMVSLHSGLLPDYLARLTRGARATVAGLLARAGAVVCVSERVADAVRGLGIEPAVASPFIAAHLRPGQPPSTIVAARAAGERILAAAVAPGSEYGADVLLAAFLDVAGSRHDLVLALFGPGGADRRLARRVDERGFGDRVVALGELPPPAALGTLAACDLFVRPTLADGDALSVREARALGRRVVASDAAPRPPGTALFPAGDARALAQAILASLAAPPPPAVTGDGLAALLRVYAKLEVSACVASPAV